MSDAISGRTLGEDCDRRPRAIVLCFDGTHGRYGSTNTNVVKFFGLLHKDSPEKQMTYYQAGIGTYFAPGIVSPLWAGVASLLDSAVAWYLGAHVMDGYQYLMENYRSGDKICLFGFSRGAYTARALAGMLAKVGLLPKDNNQQVGFAYQVYKRTDKKGIKLAAGFKQTFSQDVRVEFVGVWDTVQSTGVLVNRSLPFTSTNTDIKVFRQALSLDEHRSRFQPNPYHWSPEDVQPDDGVPGSERPAIPKSHTIKSASRQPPESQSPPTQQNTAGRAPPHDDAQQATRADGVIQNGTHSEGEAVAGEPLPPTDVLEVWFSGCHSDIGGGNVEDDVEVSLAQITLHWMVEQVMQSSCGILFDNDRLARAGFKLPTSSPQPLASRKPTLPNQPTASVYARLEPADAIAPAFDELQLNKMWWLVEVMPYYYAWQDSEGVWQSKWRINWGRGRTLPGQKLNFHHTVKERVDNASLKYKPRAVYDHESVVYV